jgi:uncharacterized protein (DUF433 family)
METCSRCRGIRVHDPVETLFTIAWNTHGKDCIREARVTVSMIVGQIGTGRRVDELLREYPYLERKDILQALRYAARRTQEREVLLANA